MMSSDQNDHSDLDRAFGAPVAVHRPRLSRWAAVWWTLAGLVLLIPGIGVLIEKEYFGGSVCIIAALPFFCLAGMKVAHRGDEMTLYEIGFIYKRRGATDACLWSEVESLSFTTSRNYNYKLSVSRVAEGDGKDHYLTGITTKTGRYIEFKEGIVSAGHITEAINSKIATQL